MLIPETFVFLGPHPLWLWALAQILHFGIKLQCPATSRYCESLTNQALEGEQRSPGHYDFHANKQKSFILYPMLLLMPKQKQCLSKVHSFPSRIEQLSPLAGGRQPPGQATRPNAE